MPSKTNQISRRTILKTLIGICTLPLAEGCLPESDNESIKQAVEEYKASLPPRKRKTLSKRLAEEAEKKREEKRRESYKTFEQDFVAQYNNQSTERLARPYQESFGKVLYDSPERPYRITNISLDTGKVVSVKDTKTPIFFNERGGFSKNSNLGEYVIWDTPTNSACPTTCRFKVELNQNYTNKPQTPSKPTNPQAEYATTNRTAEINYDL